MGPWVTFAYPFRWAYSVLNAADYFRGAGLSTAPARPADGRGDRTHPGRRQARRHLVAGGRHPGRVWFEVDVPAGEPSKWLTLIRYGCSPGGTESAPARSLGW